MFVSVEYFWASLLLFVIERICRLQEQFDRDYFALPDGANSIQSLISGHIDNFGNGDKSLSLSFGRLCRLAHLTMLVSLILFINIVFWFMFTPAPDQANTFRYEDIIVLI